MITDALAERRVAMVDLNFRCFKCSQVSAMNLTAEGRDDVRRMTGDPSIPREVTFYCERCGAANAIGLTAEMLAAFVARLSSDDPQIQKAIDDAKRGDYQSAINEALRRFKF
jgi:hypothetical protein